MFYQIIISAKMKNGVNKYKIIKHKYYNIQCEEES